MYSGSFEMCLRSVCFDLPVSYYLLQMYSSSLRAVGLCNEFCIILVSVRMVLVACLVGYHVFCIFIQTFLPFLFQLNDEKTICKYCKL